MNNYNFYAWKIVGIPQEKSCKVEGMIRSIVSEKEDLINQLKQLENAEKELNAELKEIMSHPPNHPVIEYINPIEMPDLYDQEAYTEEESTNADDQLNAEFEMGLSLSEESHMASPTPASPPAPCTPSRQVLFLNDESTAISDTLSDSGIRDVRGIQRSESPLTRGHFMCGTSFFPILRSASEDDHSDRRQRINLRQADANESIQRSPESVDFRTGLSGHIALNSSRRKKLTNEIPRHAIRMMGEHRGIASVRRFRRRPTDSPR